MSPTISFVLFLFLQTTQIYSINPKFVKHVNAVAPTDLVDDVAAQLDALGQLVLGQIIVAYDKLDESRFELTSHSLNMRLSAEASVESQRQAFEIRLTNLKELALSAQQNISSCLEGTEDQLNNMPQTHLNQIKDCITRRTEESDTVLSDAAYNIDIFINDVQKLNFALGKCDATDEDCLNDIVDQIKSAEKSVPEQIDVIVRNAQSSLELFKAEIVDCRDNGVADLVYEGSAVLTQITNCVQDIISKEIDLKLAHILFMKNHNDQQ